MGMTSLQDLLEHELKDLYNAENQLVKALPKMAKAASHPDLRAGFETHLEETQGQVKRLERIFKQLDMGTRGKKCEAMEGLIEEGKELISEKPGPAVLDAGLIAAAQKVEHYEIASYGCARTWANQLGLTEVAELLEETLEEEKATDVKLTELAMSMVNEQAEEGEEDDEEGMGNGRGNGRGRTKARSGR
jgi:ferritin-like metal-binding protein YciE